MKFNEFVLLLGLLIGCVYNVDNTLLRIILVAAWLLIPIILILLSFKCSLSYFKMIGVNICLEKEFYYSLLFILTLLASLIVNMDSFKIEVSGPSGEKFTPFLYIGLPLYLMALSCLSYSLNVREVLTKFYVLLVLIMFVDMVYRYIYSPDVFMNYQARHDAKTIGFFTTTNVTGGTLTFLWLVLLFVEINYKKIIQTIMLIILITTMARSAMLSLLIVTALYLFFRSSSFGKILGLIMTLMLVIVVLKDPFNLNLIHDGSLMSKFQFIKSTLLLIESGGIKDIIFGYGASYELVTQLLDVKNWSPHLSILKAYLYYGIIGLAFFGFYVVHLVKLHPNMTLPVISFLIFGMAGAPIFWPTLVTGLILILISEKNKRFGV